MDESPELYGWINLGWFVLRRAARGEASVAQLQEAATLLSRAKTRVMAEHERTRELEFALRDSDVEELRELFEMQQRRELDAIMRWREEDPEARELTMPDYGRLLDWLWDKVKATEASK